MLLCTVKAVAASENDTEPRKVSFKGAKQALTAFAPKIEAARPEDRAALIDAMAWWTRYVLRTNARYWDSLRASVLPILVVIT